MPTDDTEGAAGSPPVRMKINTSVIRQKLTEWAEGTQAFPFGSARKSRVFVWSYVSAAKRTLLGRLALPQEILHALSKSEIAHTESFSDRMVHFITTTRQLMAEHHGFFDKFTGDGFLVYFNEAICRRAGAGYLDCCLAFLDSQLTFSRKLFQEWSRTIRKLSSSQVGLAMGADSGRVTFHDVNHHLVAVGEAIVWATRMSDIAAAGEIAVNNLLFGTLDGKPGITFESRTGRTKAGGEFVARMLSFRKT